MRTFRPLAVPLCSAEPDKALHLDSLCQNVNLVHLEVPSDMVVAFCITTYKRTWQLKLSLPWNLMTLYPYRRVAALFVADLNPAEDTELDEFFTSVCGQAQALGILNVFKGSIPGWDASRCKNSVHFAALQKLQQVLSSSEQLTNTAIAVILKPAGGMSPAGHSHARKHVPSRSLTCSEACPQQIP